MEVWRATKCAPAAGPSPEMHCAAVTPACDVCIRPWLDTVPTENGSPAGRCSTGVLRAFRSAGIDSSRARGALVHGLRHTFATELANADVSVYTLMNLSGHESISTSQWYVTAAAHETRVAAGLGGRQHRLGVSKPARLPRLRTSVRGTDGLDRAVVVEDRQRHLRLGPHHHPGPRRDRRRRLGE